MDCLWNSFLARGIGIFAAWMYGQGQGLTGRGINERRHSRIDTCTQHERGLDIPNVLRTGEISYPASFVFVLYTWEFPTSAF